MNVNLCICEPLVSTSYSSASISVVRWHCSSHEGRCLMRLAQKSKALLYKAVREHYQTAPQSPISIRLRINEILIEDVDRAWEMHVLSFFKKMLDMERLLWCLSSLGGAYSAMGDYFQSFAETAGKISQHQLKIAGEMGNPAIVARCHLYVALSDAQMGRFKKAAYTVKMIYDWAQKNSQTLVRDCCSGVYIKILTLKLNRRNILKGNEINEAC